MGKYYGEDYADNAVVEIEGKGLTGAGGMGSSCFPKSTLVRTIHGFKAINHLLVNDVVLAYDTFGEIDFGLVSETVEHKVGEYTENVYHFYSNGVDILPEGVTENHALYDSITNGHKQAKEFKVGESFTSMDGLSIPITDIIIKSNGQLTTSVYNLTVIPQHTFIVGTEELCIRVHNGGGGKKSGVQTAPTPVDQPNTLRSISTARLLEVISQGPIVGVVGGSNGVTFNSTPLTNADGSSNFAGVIFEQRLGTPNQTAINGFSSIENEVVMTQRVITFASPLITALPNSNVDSARVVVAFPEGLWTQDRTTGNTSGTEVRFQIAVRPRGAATWSVVVDETIRDKCMTAAELPYRVAKPTGATQWDIKVARTSLDDTAANIKSTLICSRITEIVEKTLTYPNVAIVGLTVPAASVGNQIPTRGYLVQGLIIDVPNNYNTITRQYIGAWNGGFKKDWTDNPAWIMADLIKNQRYGIGSFLNMPIQIDKWEFFNAAMYCDCVTFIPSTGTYVTQLIPDGYGLGGKEVRYTFNTPITTQSDAWQLLFAVASAMRAIPVVKGAEISIIQDRRKVYTTITTNSNVIDGTFLYAGTEVTTRCTAVNVTFNDKNDNYLPVTVTEEATPAQIAKYGYRAADLAAYGCTTESAARRMAKWELYTHIHQPKFCTFSKALNVAGYEVGKVTAIIDDDLVSDTEEFLSGKVASASGIVVTLGNAITLKPSRTYIIGIMSIDGSSIIERTITSGAGTRTSITLSQAVPAGDYANIDYFCYSTGFIEPALYLIQSITESAKGIYTISCVLYVDAKYAFIEQGISLPEPVVPPNYNVLPKVTNITFHEHYVNDGVASHNYIRVNWLWNEAALKKPIVTYNLMWRRDSGEYSLHHDITLKEFNIPSIIPGTYEVIIDAESVQGKRSLSTYATYNYRTIAGQSTLVPPTSFFVIGTSNVVFNTLELYLTWQFPDENNYKTDKLLDYVLQVYDSTYTTLHSTYVIQPNRTNKNGSFIYTYAMNRTDYGTPSRRVYMKLYSRDTIGDLSVAVAKIFTNPPPVLTNWDVSPAFNAVAIKITPSVELDIKEYIVYQGTTSGFVKNDAAIAYIGMETYINMQVTAGITFYYAISIVDSFGRAGSLISTEQSATAVKADPDLYTYSGLLFKPNNPGANQVSWGAFVAYKNGGAAVFVNAGNTIAWTTGTMYLYYIPGNTTLQYSTSLLAAITVSGRILGTYRGGTDLTADAGKAFISGDQILAGTVGANALVTNTAVITNAAQFGNILESSNYSWAPGNFNGWRIDKTGWIQCTSITIRNTLGQVVFSSGTGMEWTYVNGKPTSLAAINSTEGTKLGNISDWANVAAPSANMLVNAGLYLTKDSWLLTGALGTGLDHDGFTLKGQGSMQGCLWVATGADSNVGFIYMDTPHRIPVIQGQRLEFSAYTGANRAEVSLRLAFHGAYDAILDTVNSTDTNNNEAPGGDRLIQYKRLGGFATVPVGAVTCRFLCIKQATTAGQPNSFMYMTMPYVGVADAKQTKLSDWSDGSSGMPWQFNAGNITTYIAGAAIGRALIGYAAIGTAQIEAASITSALIASAQITNAHIANASITNAKIGHLAVDTLNLADMSVSTLMASTALDIYLPTIGNANVLNIVIIAESSSTYPIVESFLVDLYIDGVKVATDFAYANPSTAVKTSSTRCLQSGNVPHLIQVRSTLGGNTSFYTSIFMSWK